MLFPWYTKYPYQNDEVLNLDWILKTIDNLVKEVSDFVTLNTIKYADPIQWNITTQYEKNTVVIDPITGSAYISTKPVPAGVGLNNEDYWNIIFTLDVISANKNITLRDDANNVLATFESDVDDWLLWQGTLYIVTRAIDIGQSYVVGYNIERYTVERFLKEYISNLKNYVDTKIGDLDDLESSDNTDLVAAINSVIDDVATLIGDLDDLDTEDKSSIVAAINELVSLISDLTTNIGDLDDLDTSDKSSIVAAINEVVALASRQNIINVKDHGLTGDGVTNEVAAFSQLLLDYPNYAYYFPKGEYIFTGGSFKGFINLVGDGDAIIKDFVYEDLNFPILNRDTPYNTFQNFFSANNLIFEGTLSNYGLTMHVQSQGSVMRCFDIRNCVFDSSNGLHLINCITGNISSCDFIHNVRGINFESCTNITVVECNWYSPIIGIDIGRASDDSAGRQGGESIMLSACQMIDGVTGIKAFRHNYLELVNCMFDYLNCGIFLNASRFARLVNVYIGYDGGDKSATSGYISPPNYACLYALSNVNNVVFSAECINCEFVAYSGAPSIPFVLDGQYGTFGEDIDIIGCRFTCLSTRINTLLYVNTCNDAYISGNRFYAAGYDNITAPFVFSNCNRLISDNNDYANCFTSGGITIHPAANNRQNNNTYQESHYITISGSSSLAQEDLTFDSTYDSAPAVVATCNGGNEYYKVICTISALNASGCKINLFKADGTALSGNYKVAVIVMHSMY